MTNAFQAEINDRKFRAAMKKAPVEVERDAGLGVQHAALETANKIKQGAPKALSTLTNSVGVDRLESLAYRSGPRVNYAPFVERGRQPGTYPNFTALEDWVKTKLGITDPDQLRDVSWAIARKIRAQGIAPQPFVQPVFDSGFPVQRLRLHVNRGVDRGLTRAGL